MRITLILVIIFLAWATACSNFEKWNNLFCRYGEEKTPCTVENYDTLKSACCSTEQKCGAKDFKKDSVCCFTDECLKRCYPGKLLKNGQVY